MLTIRISEEAAETALECVDFHGAAMEIENALIQALETRKTLKHIAQAEAVSNVKSVGEHLHNMIKESEALGLYDQDEFPLDRSDEV